MCGGTRTNEDHSLARRNVFSHRLRNYPGKQSHTHQQPRCQQSLQHIDCARESRCSQSKSHDDPKQDRTRPDSFQNVDPVPDPSILPPTTEKTKIGNCREPTEYKNRNRRKQNGTVRQSEIKPKQPGKDHRANDEPSLKHANEPRPISQENLRLGHILSHSFVS